MTRDDVDRIATVIRKAVDVLEDEDRDQEARARTVIALLQGTNEKYDEILQRIGRAAQTLGTHLESDDDGDDTRDA